MADKGKGVPAMGQDMLPETLGTSLLKVVGIGLAGGVALIAAADKLGQVIEKRHNKKIAEAAAQEAADSQDEQTAAQENAE